MMRVVSMRRAALAGTGGTAAMLLGTIALKWLGVPPAEMMKQVISVHFIHSNVMAVVAAILANVVIGICWAVFYASFFWGRLKLRPALQGLIFAALPASLAILIVYPELALVRLEQHVVDLHWRTFWAPLSGASVMSLLVGHALFGLAMGAIYQRPVGYRPDRPPAPPRAPGSRERRSRPEANPAGFMFATGIECSYPTVEHGQWRRDELASAGHYDHWQRDLELARELGVTHLRYGPPLHLVFAGPGRYRWEYIDPQMEEMREAGPEPIVDLCHFGVPTWLQNFQNAEIAAALAEYAGAFADRYPWVRFYTPVNEMYVCARMSALDGLWNEQLQSEDAFARAAWNLANASIRMSNEILKRRPDAVFVNSESGEFYQACCPDPHVQEIAKIANERRFLPLDLIFGHALSEDMRQRLLGIGIRNQEIEQLKNRKIPRRSILGVDYYEWNERLIDREGNPRALGELFGWYVIASQYWLRYRRPMMHTETNKRDGAGAPRWLWRQWHNVQLLANSGVPLVGFTWYSLTDQIDWSIALREPVGLVFPVGLFDLNREPRRVGLAYKHLIDLYKDQPDYAECRALKEILN